MNRTLSLLLPLLVGTAAVALGACSSESGSPEGSGGAPQNPSTGGLGNPNSGGSSASGGNVSATGGVTGPSSGGSSTTGGQSSGGSSTGGITTGGKATTGGVGSGGTPATGGSPGGSGGKGGNGTTTGGSSGKGGSSATGGAGVGGSATGGQGSGSGGAAMKSDGCGTATTQTLNSWVQSNIMSGTAMRPYSVHLPTGYDPMRPYPVIVLLHGCGSGTNNLPMEKQAGADAIVIRGTGSAADTCWDSSANGQDVVFFDAMVADVKARFCTDKSRFFAVGYSSGSWLANQLGCIRANVLRGLGTVTGGNPGVRNCMGEIAHMFVHDKDDTTNVISGSESARDRLLTQNHCDKSITPVAQDPSPCVRYQGCDPGYPVVWCATSGQKHNRQDNVAAPAFWKFFKEF